MTDLGTREQAVTGNFMDFPRPFASSDERESAAGLRATIDLAPIGIAHVAVEGRFLLVNDCLCRILGFECEQLLQRTFQELTAPEDVEQCLALNAQLVQGSIPGYRLEKRFLRADGSAVWTCVTVSAVRDSGGNVGFFVAIVEDISERRAAEDARRSAEETLREREEQLRALFRAAPFGIVAMDLDGAPTAHNPKSLEMHGISLREAMQGRWADALHPDDRERITSSWAAAVRTGEPWSATYRFLHRDGKVVWVSGRTASVFAHGRPIGYVGALEDITALKRAEAEREGLLEREREARRQAEHATRARDEMLAVVAHDLRNPLQTLSLGTAAMLKTPMSEAQRHRQLTIMQRTARNMDRLIGDLLDVSRTEAGSFAINRSAVEPQTLFKEMLELFEAQASERNITLSCNVAPNIPPVSGDHDRLMQLLSNILGNALKFTPPGGQVRANASVLDGALHVSIADTGPGMPLKDLPRIFDRFWMADHTSGSGAGLGLQIAKAIAEAHGGRIWAECEPGHGLTVCFSIPCANTAT